MNIGEESPAIVIEPIEVPVPGVQVPGPAEPDYEIEPAHVTEEELIPA